MLMIGCNLPKRRRQVAIAPQSLGHSPSQFPGDVIRSNGTTLPMNNHSALSFSEYLAALTLPSSSASGPRSSARVRRFFFPAFHPSVTISPP